MTRRLAPWALACLLLAGCSGTKDASTTSDAPATNASGANDPSVASDPGLAPVWAIGDWWTYTVDYPNAHESNEFTIVVYKQDAENWYLSGTDHKGDELAEFSHYPTLGPWSKALFEPTIHGFKIPFFRFPLTDGKTWTDKYRGADATWKATKKDNTFEITMTQGTAPPVLTFGYDRTVGLFTYLEFTFGATNLKLRASGHDYMEPVTVLTFTEHIHGAYPVARANPGAVGPPGQQTPFTNFNVAGDKALLWGFYYGGAAGTYEYLLGPGGNPQGQGVELHPQTADQSSTLVWGEVAKPTAGGWGLATGGATQENGGFVFAEVLEVAEAKVTPTK